MTVEQLKMCGDYQFRLVNGVFTCINRKYEGTPADIAQFYGVEVPCWTQFLRVLNYDDAIHLEYRSPGSNYVRVTISEIKPGNTF